jgi:hypothetical protein
VRDEIRHARTLAREFALSRHAAPFRPGDGISRPLLEGSPPEPTGGL